MADVISMKDWVPGWVRDSYATESEVDAFNEEFRQSQLEQSNAPASSDNNQARLVKEAAAKLESIDRNSLEKWLHCIPAELLVELVDNLKS